CTVSAFGCTGTIRLPNRCSTCATPYAARSRLDDRPTTAHVSPSSVRILRTVASSPYTADLRGIGIEGGSGAPSPPEHSGPPGDSPGGRCARRRDRDRPHRAPRARRDDPEPAVAPW